MGRSPKLAGDLPIYGDGKNREEGEKMKEKKKEERNLKIYYHFLPFESHITKDSV